MPEPAGTFHEGEVALQREAGVAERLARLGHHVIRDYMPEQHRAFYPLLPFIVVGSVGAGGQPRASLLAAPPGFVWSPEPSVLRIDALPAPADPLDANLRPGAPIGLLGIQPHTRRRNRANGTVLARNTTGITVAVEQSFGNCPKYIHPREIVYDPPHASPAARVSTTLDAEARALVAAADTFFIASAHPDAARGTAGRADRSHGVDVSHRGGPLGFLQFVGSDRFVMPDYHGNDVYSTLGNLRLHAAAGLLFVDLVRGNLLELSVMAVAEPGAHALAGPNPTGRIVRFDVQGARFVTGGSPLRVVTSHDMGHPTGRTASSSPRTDVAEGYEAVFKP